MERNMLPSDRVNKVEKVRSSKDTKKKSVKRKKESKDKKRSKNRSKTRKRKREASSSSSDDSSSSSSSSSEDEKEAKRRRKKAKKAKKLKRKARMESKQRLNQEISVPEIIIPLPVKVVAAEVDVGPHIDLKSSKIRAPMTKEEYEKQQNTLTWITDSETGRRRLIRGGGEIVEELVSKERHQAINKQATSADGNFFQAQSLSMARNK